LLANAERHRQLTNLRSFLDATPEPIIDYTPVVGTTFW